MQKAGTERIEGLLSADLQTTGKESEGQI